jgi:putative ABC transport system permease protein
MLLSDLRHALRRWRRRPAFALTAILTLALGIAATTALFSVVDAVLLRPLPWPDPDRLVSIHAVEPERLQRPAQAADWDRAPLGWREWEALRETAAFEEVAAWMPNRFLFTGDAGPELRDGLFASSNLLQTLGVSPVRGRMFTADEDRTGSNNVLISYELWQRVFGGVEDAIGRTMHIGTAASSRGEPWTIVGILPAGLQFQGQRPELMQPLGVMATHLSYEWNRGLRLLGRLEDNVSIAAARDAAAPSVRPTETSSQRHARLIPLTDEEIGRAARPLWLIFGGAALLLIIACANVAGLLLGEARARRHEIAVRTSLGGGLGRILRQLAVEQVLLAGAASLAGVVLAMWLTPALVTLAPERLPRLDLVAIDLRVAALGCGAGILTTLAFLLMPAVVLARTPTVTVLNEGGRDGAGRRTIGHRLVVAAEIALALVLVVGASLFGESLARLTAQPLGFRPDGLIVVSLAEAARPYTADEWQRVLALRNNPSLAGSGFRPEYAVLSPAERDTRILALMGEQADRFSARTRDVLNRLEALPNVTSVAAVASAPFAAVPADTTARRPDQPLDDTTIISRFDVTHEYFQTLGLRILRGREFDDNEALSARRAIVSRELEQRLFDGDAVGQYITLFASSTSPGMTHEIIGVADNVKPREYSDDDRSAVYLLDDRRIGGPRTSHFLVRTSRDPAPLLPLVRQTLQASTNPPLVVSAVHRMDDLVAGTVAEPRFRAVLAVVFGAAALVLATVGLYGLASRRVEERRREIGVRMALGAARRDVRRLVVTDALRTLMIGLAFGLPAAFAASQVTQTFLFGVPATAPRVYLLASAVLAAAAVLATLVPARRAAATDPMIVLRE